MQGALFSMLQLINFEDTCNSYVRFKVIPTTDTKSFSILQPVTCNTYAHFAVLSISVLHLGPVMKKSRYYLFNFHPPPSFFYFLFRILTYPTTNSKPLPKDLVRQRTSVSNWRYGLRSAPWCLPWTAGCSSPDRQILCSLKPPLIKGRFNPTLLYSCLSDGLYEHDKWCLTRMDTYTAGRKRRPTAT